MSPDPRFYFSSKGHHKAMSYLQYGMNQGEGFIVITGDIGTGKTTVVKNLLKKLDADSFIARQLVTTYLDEGDLIEMVSESFNLPSQGLSKAARLNQLYKFFINSYKHKKRILLIVDEVQNLPLKTVEELRMLSNFQLNDKPLIQSFLVGQREFIETLQSDQMEQLRQRVIASTHLGPLKEQETEEYINYRLKRAGNAGGLFDHNSCLLIHELTEGVPRRINVFCDRILLYGYLEEIERFTVEHINLVADELSNEVTSPVKKILYNDKADSDKFQKQDTKDKKQKIPEPELVSIGSKNKQENKESGSSVSHNFTTASESSKKISKINPLDLNIDDFTREIKIMSEKLEKQLNDISDNLNYKDKT